MLAHFSFCLLVLVDQITPEDRQKETRQKGTVQKETGQKVLLVGQKVFILKKFLLTT